MQHELKYIKIKWKSTRKKNTLGNKSNLPCLNGLPAIQPRFVVQIGARGPYGGEFRIDQSRCGKTTWSLVTAVLMGNSWRRGGLRQGLAGSARGREKVRHPGAKSTSLKLILLEKTGILDMAGVVHYLRQCLKEGLLEKMAGLKWNVAHGLEIFLLLRINISKYA